MILSIILTIGNMEEIIQKIILNLNYENSASIIKEITI